MTTMTDRKNAAISRGVGMTTQIYAERAENAEIWDKDGNRYIDFAAGIAVVNTGHRHPKVIEAVKAQLDRFTHTCHQVVPYENYVALAERLNSLVPGDFDKKTIFATTGAEAVENAIKIARFATGRSAVVVFTGAFHGRTMGALALTSKEAYRTPFEPLPGEVTFVPYGDAEALARTQWASHLGGQALVSLQGHHPSLPGEVPLVFQDTQGAVDGHDGQADDIADQLLGQRHQEPFVLQPAGYGLARPRLQKEERDPVARVHARRGAKPVQHGHAFQRDEGEEQRRQPRVVGKGIAQPLLGEGAQLQVGCGGIDERRQLAAELADTDDVSRVEKLGYDLLPLDVRRVRVEPSFPDDEDVSDAGSPADHRAAARQAQLGSLHMRQKCPFLIG